MFCLVTEMFCHGGRKCSATVEECSATVEECSATVGECSALVHLRWGSEIKTVRTPVLAETAPENLSEFLDDVPKC